MGIVAAQTGRLEVVKLALANVRFTPESGHYAAQQNFSYGN